MPHQPARPTPPQSAAPVPVPIDTERQVQLALYEETFVAPVRRLNESLTDVLDVDAHPHRDPETALALVKDAVDRFAVDADGWLGSGSNTGAY